VLLDDARLLAFAWRLQSAADIGDVLRFAADEIKSSIGYRTAWIAVFDLEVRQCRILAAQGAADADIWAHAPVMPIDTDPYVLRILTATGPVVVEDARTDPGVNRAIVDALGNRTIVNVPMRLLDQPFGMLGTGSFGDEGVHLPTPEELTYLVGLAGQLVVASARILLVRQREDAARERTALDRKLQQRQKLESLGELAGGIAHDFNNLLTIIMASASMLEDGEVDEARRDELKLISDAAERAAQLTRRLLALGQRQPLQLAPSDPTAIVSSVVSMLRRVIPADITVELVNGAAMPAVLVEASQIEQVITNPCLNARDAMPLGGRLTIESEATTLTADFVDVHPWAKAGRYVLVTVSDTGEGMSPEVLERIFEPFYTTKTESRGTGLGLAVCRGITEQHGGFIHAYSEVGLGSTFKVYLPVSAREIVAAAPKAATTSTQGTERILVADDEPHVRRAIERVLRRAGYDVVAVADGRAAVEAVTNERFHLVILDAVMPRLSGRAALEEVRAAAPGVPVLFASGYGAEELTARFLSDTGVPVLSKPFDPDTLLSTVRSLLNAPA